MTSYFSLPEAGLGLCAACLPVQYGLLRSEKVAPFLGASIALQRLVRAGLETVVAHADPVLAPV